MASSDISKNVVHEDPWSSLRSFTSARIALGKTGVSVPLKEVLTFKLAHAHARDAVFSELKTNDLINGLQPFGLPVYLLKTCAENRIVYLQKPDQGRRLHLSSAGKLHEAVKSPYDVAIVITDGLSASAINIHSVCLLQQLFVLFKQYNYAVAPVVIVQQGRVAVADEVGHLLSTKLSLILIGERPGLTMQESMGAYITYGPRPGLTDEARNCISNIHPGGLSYETAAKKIIYFIRAAMELKLSGITLKEDDRFFLDK